MRSFQRAERFILNASNCGGVVPPGQSFLERGTRGIRVDIEVITGTAFVK